ncbi:HNH endonuclease [Paenibacillus lactis]|uniref:HNH endonuclease n=1 Tax=Paenibacillus lactis TaxID=228574 RepID=UPI003D74875A
MKVCSICKAKKTLDQFYSQQKQSKSKGNYIYYHPECKECTKKKSSEWQREHPLAKIKTKRKYDIKPERRQIRKEYNRLRRVDGYHRDYYKNNTEKFKSYRYTRLSNKKHNINLEEWQNCLIYFNCACAYCGMTWEEHFSKYGQDLHKEHVVFDGKDNLSNCVPSCKKCNSEKSMFSLNNWYNKQNPIFSRLKYLRIFNWLKSDYKRFIMKHS